MLKPSFTITLYTDGACRGNGKPDASGGWGVYSKDLNLELCGGETPTTNNRMELTGAIEAVKYIVNERSIANMCSENKYIICSDSNYVVKGVTEWMQGWVRKNWNEVKNTDLWKEMNKLLNDNPNVIIDWQWVKGHSISEGNIKADELANKGCDGVTLQKESFNQYIDKESFVNFLLSDIVISNIGKAKVEVIEQLYDYFVSGKYSKKNNLFIDSAYMIFITMSYTKNRS